MCSGISVGVNVLFVHVVGASFGREVRMCRLGDGIPVGI